MSKIRRYFWTSEEVAFKLSPAGKEEIDQRSVGKSVAGRGSSKGLGEGRKGAWFLSMCKTDMAPFLNQQFLEVL